MTVHHIIPDHELGGGAVVTARLIAALAEAGEAERHVALLPGNATPATRRVFANVPHVIGDYAGRGSPLAIAKGVLRVARGGDIVHGQGTRAAFGALLARGLGGRFRVVYTVHGFHGLADPGFLGLRRPLENAIARGVHATAFVSEADAVLAEAAGLRHRGPTMVIENGIDVPPAAPDAPRDVDLLFVGRLVRQKWPEAFVETLLRLPGAPRAVMIGAGELAAEVDALAASLAPGRLVRIDGAAPEETLGWMARARVLVMTSRWEGLPTVAIEAAQSRAAVAGFDIPPLAEVVGEAGRGLLCPPDPDALASLLGALLADEPRRLALAEAVHGRARARFAPSRMAERYRELYRLVRA